MHKVTVKRKMLHNSTAVWKVLDDFGEIYKYHPDVKSSNILSQKATGTGAQRVCNFHDGTSIKETIVKYDANHGYILKLTDFSVPLKEANAHFKIESLNNNQSLLSITLVFIPKFGPLGWVMGKLMMRPMLTKALKKLGKGLDDYIRTGQFIGKDGSLLEAA